MGKRCWSETEHSDLLEAVEAVGQDWEAVSSAVGTRNARQCKLRWIRLSNNHLNRYRWTPEEDAFILNAAPLFQKSWSVISALLDSRTPGAVSKRHKRLLEAFEDQAPVDPNPPSPLEVSSRAPSSTSTEAIFSSTS